MLLNVFLQLFGVIVPIMILFNFLILLEAFFIICRTTTARSIAKAFQIIRVGKVTCRFPQSNRLRLKSRTEIR